MRRTRPTRSLIPVLLGLALLLLIGQRRAAPIRAAAGDAGGDGLYANEQERERALRYNRRREVAGRWSGWAGRRLSTSSRWRADSRGGCAGARSGSRRDGSGRRYRMGWRRHCCRRWRRCRCRTTAAGWSSSEYGLSNQTRRAWAAEQAKGAALGLALGLPVLHGGLLRSSAASRAGGGRSSPALTIPFTIILATSRRC